MLAYFYEFAKLQASFRTNMGSEMRGFSLKVVLLTLATAVALPAGAASAPNRTATPEAKKKSVQVRGTKQKRDARETREAREHRKRQMALDSGVAPKSGSKRRGGSDKKREATAHGSCHDGTMITPHPTSETSTGESAPDPRWNWHFR
nr:hypothetical protein [Oxalobacteraceae bacterium]